ncbi:MAG: DUF5050 domain-containing protein [Deltaproteobacteria bacterium]
MNKVKFMWIIMAVCITTFVGCGKKPEPVVNPKPFEKQHISERGNTFGNIANKGLAAACGDWIYYSNKGLHKMKKDGTGDTKINNDICKNINVIGDWIYYNKVTENKAKASNVEDGLWKVKIDGTSKAKLGDITNINIIGNKIYGVRERKEEKTEFDGDKVCPLSLYIMSIDGKQKTELKDFFKSSPYRVDDMVVIEDWIYFSGGDLQQINLELYKKKADGAGEALLVDNVNEARSFYVDGDWIYYCDDNEFGFKMKTDGTKKIKLQNVKSILNVVDGWIYFGDSNALYKVKADGTELTRLLLKRDMVLNKNEDIYDCDFFDKLNVTQKWGFYYDNYGSLIKINLSDIANGSSKTIGDFAKDICPKGMDLLETLEADVNGDNITEYLLGFGKKGREFQGVEFQKVSFVVKDTAANTYSECGNLAVYNHKLLFIDNFSFIKLNKDNKKQILINYSGYDDNNNQVNLPASVIYEIDMAEKLPGLIQVYTITWKENGAPAGEIRDIDKDGVDELSEFEERTKNSGLMHYKKWNGKKFVQYKSEIVYLDPNDKGY